MPIVDPASRSGHSPIRGIPLNSLDQYANALGNAVHAGIKRESASRNHTLREFELLRLFLMYEEWTASELARVLPLTVSAVSRLVSSLVDRGLLLRRRPTNDRRVVLLRLSAAGLALAQEIGESVQDYEEQLMEGVGDEEAANFRFVMMKILDNHANMRGCSTGMMLTGLSLSSTGLTASISSGKPLHPRSGCHSLQ